MTLSRVSFLVPGALAMLVSVIAAAQVGPARPRWALHWYGGKGDFYINTPVCGPLQTFTGNLTFFDYDKDLLGLSDIRDDVKSEQIGTISGFAVYDVLHSIDNRGEPFFAKMIVAERRPGDFCEIFQEEYASVNVIAKPLHFIEVGSERLLATTDDVTGTGGFRIEEYWAFDSDGPIPIYLYPYTEAVREVLPLGYSIRKGGGPNLETLSYDSSVWKKDDANCCPSGGEVHIKFAFKDHKLVVTSKEYRH